MLKPGPKGPHGKPRVVAGTLREKAWRAMQIKGKFTLTDLCRAALTGEEAARDPRGNIAHYLRGLARAGIVAAMKTRPAAAGGGGEKRWLLVRDLGRLAPTLRRTGAVYDPNAGREVPHA